MANTKPTFAKLKLAKNNQVKIININDFEIEVKQYLPVEDKLALIANVINYSVDVNNFMNPVKVELFGTLEIIYAYTNIVFTEKQKEDPVNLYDIFISSGAADKIIAEIPSIEYEGIINNINECIEYIYQYKNSAMGILDAVSQDYKDLDLDASSIQNKLADPKAMETLKDVLTKMG